jgi:hypothetical protein
VIAESGGSKSGAVCDRLLSGAVTNSRSRPSAAGRLAGLTDRHWLLPFKFGGSMTAAADTGH